MRLKSAGVQFISEEETGVLLYVDLFSYSLWLTF